VGDNSEEGVMIKKRAFQNANVRTGEVLEKGFRFEKESVRAQKESISPARSSEEKRAVHQTRGKRSNAATVGQ